MKIEFHAIIRQQSESLIITIPKEVAGMLKLKSKETKKFIIETYNDSKSENNSPSSKLSSKGPNTSKSTHEVEHNSDGAKLFQQGYMRRKDIIEILKEDRDNDSRR